MFAGMAQQVEQFTRNEQVIGSNPITSSKDPLLLQGVFCFARRSEYCRNLKGKENEDLISRP